MEPSRQTAYKASPFICCARCRRVRRSIWGRAFSKNASTLTPFCTSRKLIKTKSTPALNTSSSVWSCLRRASRVARLCWEGPKELTQMELVVVRKKKVKNRLAIKMIILKNSKNYWSHKHQLLIRGKSLTVSKMMKMSIHLGGLKKTNKRWLS